MLTVDIAGQVLACLKARVLNFLSSSVRKGEENGMPRREVSSRHTTAN